MAATDFVLFHEEDIVVCDVVCSRAVDMTVEAYVNW